MKDTLHLNSVLIEEYNWNNKKLKNLIKENNQFSVFKF